jgi:drug/metabolite transporter (DMT)-like permease
MSGPRARPRHEVLALTACAMVAFAANSVLCRLALRAGAIDAGSFTAIRLAAGALALAPLLLRSGVAPAKAGSWWSALALCAYAGAFSFAYVRLSAGVGALVLFGAVQLTMVGAALRAGQRFSTRQQLGFAMASAGLVALTLPGAHAPDPLGLALMVAAGAAWGVYSLRGARATAPIATTAGNFLRTLPLAALLALAGYGTAHVTSRGLLLAALSGALASGLGYVIWYGAVRHLLAVEAALVQLSVPVLAALAGALLLGEALAPRVIVAGSAILAGIAFALRPSSEA